MYKLKDTSLEWALLHLQRFPDSDFFPRQFEFEAVSHSWPQVKDYLLGIDFDEYAPATPSVYLAEKPNGTFRVVHQLDPFDCLLYTALIYENIEFVESFRLPADRQIACSYRFVPDSKGSFIEANKNGYGDFTRRCSELAEVFQEGFVLICDLVDFYNQIYLHRVNNLFSEAGAPCGDAVEKFLMGLNTNVSKGIPVGPFPSIVISELVMADIDKKILTYTDEYARYVDDMCIFFKSEDDAREVLHHLTSYLYSNHRLVISSDKTKIISVGEFRAQYLENEETIEKERLQSVLDELKTGKYPTYEEDQEFDDLEPPEKFALRVESYVQLFTESIAMAPLSLGMMRHLLRQASRYKVRALVPLVIAEFRKLLPVIRDAVLYLDKVITAKLAAELKEDFQKLFAERYLNTPYNNLWIYTLLQNPAFKDSGLKYEYKAVHRIRDRALLAKNFGDTTWIKDQKTSLDTFAPQDRRAVITAASCLSADEVTHWLRLESAKKNLLNSVLCAKVISDKNSK